MGSLKNKVIWLTGASSGIGEALTYELVKRGARLILSSRRKDELEKVKGNCDAAAQPNIRILPMDLSSSSTLQLSVEAAVQTFGHVDILINNAGLSQRSFAKETALEVDRKLMEVNYFGPVALSKYLLPYFLKQKGGYFVVITSLAGKFGTPYRSGYSAAKHALHGFYESLRAEMWKDNIAVTMIAPGFIQTPISLSALTGDGMALNQMDNAQQKGKSVKSCARQIANAMERQKEEVYIGGKEIWAVHVKRFFPKIFSRIIRNAKVR